MRKKLLSYLLTLLPCIHLIASSHDSVTTPPPFFSNKLTTHFYGGQDLNVLNNPSFDPYTVFQYIDDFGVEIKEEPIRETSQTISLLAKARVKGIFGNTGSGLVPLQEVAKFKIWLREASLLYAPTENKNSFLQGGLIPFKVGNGFVLGNAYNISIPIAWQYVYEQIDQFRPGIVLQIGNQKKSVTATAYVGFITAQHSVSTPLASPFAQNAIDTALENLDSVFVQFGSKNTVAALQLNIDPFDTHNFQISPYIFFQKSGEFVELPNDATNTLCTPGFYGSYQWNDLRINFEAARNFGHQHVEALDRNVILQATTSTLDPNITLNYDRFRNSYYNNYAGYVLYLESFLTKENLTWAVAGVYASGANDPNDSYATILLTHNTPNVQHKDYNKKYKGFIGVNQFSDATNVNGLYFGAGDYRYTNLALVGSTVQYSLQKDVETLSTQATVVSYFKPTALILNVTTPAGINPFSALPHYLGTEFNCSGTYTLDSHVTFSLLGGIFFPGAFYKDLQQQLLSVEQETVDLFNPTASSITSIPPQKAAFFISFALSWLFDSSDIKSFFERHQS